MDDIGKQESPSLGKQIFACFAIYTLSMSIGAGAGFSGVSIPQVEIMIMFTVELM